MGQQLFLSDPKLMGLWFDSILDPMRLTESNLSNLVLYSLANHNTKPAEALSRNNKVYNGFYHIEECIREKKKVPIFVNHMSPKMLTINKTKCNYLSGKVIA